MGLGDYGLTLGSATQGFRQQEQDAMKKESFDMNKEKYKLEMEKAKKTLAKEGYREALQMMISGDVRGAEEHFNSIGDDRVKPGSTKYNRKTGLVTWIDKQGEEQAADIRMMAAMGGVTLPKLPEKGSSMKERNYGLKVSRLNLSKRKWMDSRQKEARNTYLGVMGGKRDPMGQYSLPAGNEERAGFGISTVDRIEAAYPGRFTAGRLADVMKTNSKGMMTLKEAEVQATQEAEAQAGVFTSDKEDFKKFGGKRENFIKERAREIYQQSKNRAIRSVMKTLGIKTKALPKKEQIDYLLSNNSAKTRAFFDEKFGKGSADRILKAMKASKK